MGTHMLPGREQWRALRRSIRFTTVAILAIPILAAAVMWIFAGVTLSGALAHHSSAGVHGTVLTKIAVAEAIGLAAILIAAAGMIWFARRVWSDATSLEASARRFADHELPQLVERLRRGDTVEPEGQFSAPAQMKVTELSRAAAALASVQRTALTAAATETGLRSGISQVFVSLARRSQSLLQRQLRLLDDLERKAVDPKALADLFPLDHLTTRMRRHAEGLIILSGAVPGRAWSNPVPVIDVVRGAIAEVEDYKRIVVVSTSEDMVQGSAVADMIHLLAELIENATLFSPSGTRVEVKAERVGNGFAFEIEDRGLGIKPEELDAINLRLGSPADFDLANADQLGLFVVGKLAARHGVSVFLRPSPYGGTTAIVLMPISMIAPLAESAPAAVAADAGREEDLHLALTGHSRPQPLPADSDAPRPPARPGALPVRKSIFASQPDTGASQTQSRPSEPAFFPSQPTLLGEPVFPNLAGAGRGPQPAADLGLPRRSRPGAGPEPSAMPRPPGPPSPFGPPSPSSPPGTSGPARSARHPAPRVRPARPVRPLPPAPA
jgi:signal transduction histidine kinase